LARYDKAGLRLAVAVLVAGGAVVALGLIHRGAIDPAVIRDAIAGNPFAPALFVLFQIAASLLFVPRTVLGIAAGLLFGFAWGAFWAIIGAVAGAAVGFALVRWMGGGQIDVEATPRLGPLIERAERGGWRAVAIVRLIPGLPHSVVNTALALTRLKWGPYLAGSFTGMLPMTLVQVDIGAAGGQALRGQGGWILASLLLATGLAASFLIKRAASKRA
jgi:uncharacterized membrane protein YdjX (TVP38/TMEM64 family)